MFSYALLQSHYCHYESLIRDALLLESLSCNNGGDVIHFWMCKTGEIIRRRLVAKQIYVRSSQSQNTNFENCDIIQERYARLVFLLIRAFYCCITILAFCLVSYFISSVHHVPTARSCTVRTA